MTEKRNNRLTAVETLSLTDVEKTTARLAEIQAEAQEANAVIYDVSNIVNDEGALDLTRAETHDLQVIPTFSADENKTLVNVALALTPKFDEVIKSEIGIKYLSDSYFSKVIKRVRDNLRQAIFEGKQYKLPIEIADFLSTSRAPSQSAELKRAIAELVKMLVAKFATKYPYAKPLLTAKTMTSALANEAFAKQVYPFLIAKDGTTILQKWLENTKAQFIKSGIATAEIDSLLETRLTAEVEADEEDSSLEDLF